MGSLMDLVAGDARDIVLALSVDDVAAFDDPDRFVAHLPLGGGLDPTWLDLFSEAVRSVTEQAYPVDFLDARSELGDGADVERIVELVDPAWISAVAGVPEDQLSALAGRWIGLARGGAGPPAARGEALDPRPDGADRRLRATLGPRPGRGLRLGLLSDRMPTFDERAREWDTDDRRRVADGVASAIRSAIVLTPTRGRSRSGRNRAARAGPRGRHRRARPRRAVDGDAGSGPREARGPRSTRTSAVAFDLVNDPPLTPPFDLAISQLVLHHIEDTASALRALGALLRPGGRLALSDLDTEDGTFHGPDAEGIHHLGFDRDRLRGLAEAAGFADVGFTAAHVYENERGAFPMFLLTATRS